MSNLDAIRGDLEDLAEKVGMQFKDRADYGLTDEALDMAETLADLVSTYFREQDWEATMAELRERVAS